jgi:hypothetical protein
MSKKIVQTKSVTQSFRDLAVGETLRMLATHYESPHSFARAAGIRVETEVLHKNTTGKFLMKVTRLAPDKKKSKTAK